MKSALINRWLDLRASIDPKKAGWMVPIFDMWRIETILEERYGYNIGLGSRSEVLHQALLDACK